MKKATYKLIGIKPLLFHAFRPEVVETPRHKTSKTGQAGINKEEWKETLFSEGTKLYIPDTYFFAFLRSGGSFIKVGRGTIKNKVIACITIPEMRYYFSNRKLPKDVENMENEDLSSDPTKPLFLHVSGVTNPATKGRNVRYRLGLGAGWEIESSVVWDDSIVSKEQMQDAVEAAAAFSGMADGRNTGYGRCRVENFNIEKENAKHK
jgi:hypothetical protein